MNSYRDFTNRENRRCPLGLGSYMLARNMWTVARATPEARYVTRAKVVLRFTSAALNILDGDEADVGVAVRKYQ